VASHLVGQQMKDCMKYYLAGKIAEADKIYMDLMPLIKALFVVSNPVPVKYALNQVGFNVGKPRLPLVEPDAKSAASIKEALKGYKIDLPLD
jgi:4-hydroxy-tetrahydrodipicolinate synthase